MLVTRLFLHTKSCLLLVVNKVLFFVLGKCGYKVFARTGWKPTPADQFQVL